MDSRAAREVRPSRGRTLALPRIYARTRARTCSMRPYRCGECGGRFAHAGTLWRHRQRHGAPPVRCGACGRGFSRLPYLLHHVLRHHVDRRAALVPSSVQCSRCARWLATERTLRAHVGRCAAAGPPVPVAPHYTCPACRHTYSSPTWFLRHVSRDACRGGCPAGRPRRVRSRAPPVPG